MQDKLEPKYGLFTALSIVVGSVVGVGIFLRAPRMSLTAGGDTLAIMLSWVLAALVILPIAIVISEVASMTKRSGGVQIYGEEAFNSERFGFGIGWAQAFFYLPSIFVLMLYLMVDYTFKVAGVRDADFTQIVFLGTFYAVTLFLINSLSGRIGGWIQVVATSIKVIPLILIGVVGAMHFGEPLSTLGGAEEIREQFLNNASLPFFTKVAALLPAALFAYDGWIYVCVISGEVKNPGRNIPLAVLGGLSVIVLLYLLFMFASFKVATPEAWATGGVTNADVASYLFGGFFGDILNAFVLVSAFGVGNAISLTMVRAPYALATTRRFYGSAWLSKLNSKTKMPSNSGFLSLGVVLIYFLTPYFLGVKNEIEVYSLFSDSGLLLYFFFYALICIGVVRMRKTHPEIERPFKVPLIHLFAALSLIGVAYGIYGLISAYLGSLLGVIIFIICACSGFVLYSFTKKEEHSLY